MNAKQEYGKVAALLIHLAGADPTILKKVPANESSEYIKLGASVLVPGLLAVTAGTFTIHHLSPDTHILIAILVGLAWAAMILVIDVAVMSQLTKVPEGDPQRPKFTRAYEKPNKEKEDEQKGVRKRAQRIAMLRMSVAILLGALMSHSLVLAMFYPRIAMEMSATRVSEARKLEDVATRAQTLEQQYNAAELASLTLDDASFARAYERYLSQFAGAQGQAAIDSSTGIAPATASGPKDPIVESLNAELQELSDKRGRELQGLRAQLQLEQQGLVAWRSDLREARIMLKAEERGLKQTTTFRTTEFREAFGDSTTGRAGAGSEAKKIADALERLGKAEKEKAEKIPAIEKEIAAKSKALNVETQAIQQKIDQRKATLREQNINRSLEAEKLAKAEEERTRAEIRAARQRLKTEMDLIRQRRDEAQQARSLAMRPYQGGSDILEQTAALFKLMLGSGSSSSGIQTAITSLLVCFVFVGLVLIDLTPLLLKFLKAPGAYEVVLARERRASMEAEVPSARAVREEVSVPRPWPAAPKPPESL